MSDAEQLPGSQPLPDLQDEAFANSCSSNSVKPAVAYVTAYSRAPKDATRAAARKIRGNPAISDRIEYLRQSGIDTFNESEFMCREYVLGKLRTLIENTGQVGAPTYDAKVQVKCLDMLGREVGLFHPTHNINVRRTEDFENLTDEQKVLKAQQAMSLLGYRIDLMPKTEIIELEATSSEDDNGSTADLEPDRWDESEGSDGSSSEYGDAADAAVPPVHEAATVS